MILIFLLPAVCCAITTLGYSFHFTAKAAKYGALQGFYGTGYRGMPDHFVFRYVTLLSKEPACLWLSGYSVENLCTNVKPSRLSGTCQAFETKNIQKNTPAT